jgi:hypothetical protein
LRWWHQWKEAEQAILQIMVQLYSLRLRYSGVGLPHEKHYWTVVPLLLSKLCFGRFDVLGDVVLAKKPFLSNNIWNTLCYSWLTTMWKIAEGSIYLAQDSPSTLKLTLQSPNWIISVVCQCQIFSSCRKCWKRYLVHEQMVQIWMKIMREI